MKFKILVAMLLLSTAAWATPEKPQVLTFNSGAEPDSLDPAITTTVDGQNLSLQLFEGLVSLHPSEDKVIPGVAERWTLSPDGKIYTFYLRKTARWSDGSPLTAQDFVYAWERAVNPKTGAQQAGRYQYIKNGKDYLAGKIKDPALLGFKALDSHTFRVELTYPFPPFLELASSATFMPVKKEIVEKYGDSWIQPEHIVSNGPFMLKAWRAYDRLVLVKNPNYWDAKNVSLDEIDALVIEDLETALKLYETGQIDFLDHIPITQVPFLKNRPDFHNTPSFGVYFYPINTQHPILKDPRIRRALALSIDRKTLVENVLRIGQKPALGWVPSGVQGYPYKEWISYNPAQAKKLLAEAGYPDGKDFPVLKLSYNTNDAHKMIAETIQQMWKKNLGIQVQMSNNDWKIHVSNLHNHNFEIARFGGMGDYIYPATFLQDFVTGDPQNTSQWTSPNYDKVWEEAAREVNPVKRLKLYSELEKILSEAMPTVPIYYYVNQWMVKPYVKGCYLKTLSSFVFKNVSIHR